MSRVSKFLSLVLRHDPGRIGIVLDDAGWTDVDALLAACASHGVALTRDELAAIVAESDKQRFALSPDGARIRANQGHSVEVDLQLAPASPPELLYHGTVEPAIASIREQGLQRGSRHHVHLSADVPTATKVGARRGKPVILTVRAADLAATGHPFYLSDNGVWLTDHVPPRFVVWHGPRGSGTRSRADKIQIAQQSLAACEAGRYTNAAGQVIELRAAIDAAVEGTTTYELGRHALDVARPADASTAADAPAVTSVDADDEATAPASTGPRATSQVAAAATGPRAATPIEVSDESTIDALRRLAPRGGHLGCLNFASAKNPGGGFLRGAQAQEESLARSSALYPCLTTQSEHYDRNRAAHSALYLDLAIVSPGVPFFRDDDGAWLDKPVLATVITCAAPNAGALRRHGTFDAAAVEDILRRRARFVLDLAAHHRIDHLVLGAWGAGVFGNDPALVARAFGDPLRGELAHTFRSVVFAVLGDNRIAFESAFR